MSYFVINMIFFEFMYHIYSETGLRTTALVSQLGVRAACIVKMRGSGSRQTRGRVALFLFHGLEAP
jgi:hypothetical protein